MIQVIALLVSYIPAVLLYFYLRNLRKEDKTYTKDCRSLLFKGFTSFICIFLLSFILNIVWGLLKLDQIHPLLNLAFKNFVLAALAEEVVKYLISASHIRKKEEGVSWLDMIAFTGIVGLGFHILESIVYFFSTNLIQILVRGITSTHCAYGMLIGYYMGKAKKSGRKLDVLPGILIAVFLHGMYDFSLADELTEISDIFIFLPFLMAAIGLVVLVRMILLIRRKRNDPEFTTPL